MNQREEARRHFTLARDLDTLRFRSDSRINAAIHRVTGEWQPREVRLADVEATLARESADGIPGGEWFYEHVHLTFAGNYLVSLASSVLLSTNKTYGFDVTSNGSQNRFFETHGTSNNVYGGGTAYQGSADGIPGGPDNLFNALVGDRVFPVELDPFTPGPPQISQQPADVTVLVGGTARFSVQLVITTGATYQWLQGGTNIPGATNASYSRSPVAASDHGAQFFCAITNAYGSTNSSTATLTISTNGILREVYTGISGSAVSDLTNNANFPRNPTTVEVLENFEAPVDLGESYASA